MPIVKTEGLFIYFVITETKGGGLEMIMLYAVVTRIYNIKLITEEREGFIKITKIDIP